MNKRFLVDIIESNMEKVKSFIWIKSKFFLM